MSELDPRIAEQMARITAGAETVIGEGELRDRIASSLRSGRPLRVKLGMDPSAPDLHLGHTITLEKLRVFQELGHTPIFLVGDFTARIGDPTGRSKTRPALDEEAVRRNAATYVEQVRAILDVDRVEIRFNSEWMNAMTPADFVRLCSRYTVARLLEREDFSARHREGVAISLHEFLYPLVQGYDSVALQADVELGGSDQLFNLLVGRELQRDYGQSPQIVMTHPLLVGTDGSKKMSKSLGNTIGIADAADDIYGRAMSLSDELMHTYIRLLDFGRMPALVHASKRVLQGNGSPLALKHDLASELVARFRGVEAAAEARARFERTVQRKEAPEEIADFSLPVDAETRSLGLLAVLRQAFGLSSNAEARRLVAQGAVRVGGEPVGDPTAQLGPGEYLIQAGKRRYVRVRLI